MNLAKLQEIAKALDELLTEVDGTGGYQAKKSGASALAIIRDEIAREGSETWQIVPKEPTEAMIQAAYGALQELIDSVPPEERAKRWPRPDSKGYRVRQGEKTVARYRAMIAAAPSPPASDWDAGARAMRADAASVCGRNEAIRTSILALPLPARPK